MKKFQKSYKRDLLTQTINSSTLRLEYPTSTMDSKQFAERVHFMETLCVFSEEELNTFIRFADGALLISNLETKETISKDVARKLICLDPWIFHLYQQLELEDEDLHEFKKTITEAKKIKKLLCRFEGM